MWGQQWSVWGLGRIQGISSRLAARNKKCRPFDMQSNEYTVAAIVLLLSTNL